MLDFIICAASNLFRMYLINRFVVTFLGRLEKNKIKEYLIYICFYIVNTALFWEFHTVWINVLCNLVGIGIIVWLHTKSAKTILFVTCSIYLIHAGCDAVGTGLFINYKDGEVPRQVYAAIAVFLIFICELIAEKIITIRRNMEISPSFSLILIPLCSVAVICLLTYLNAYIDRGIAIICIGLLIVNFFMLYLYNLLLRSVEQKYETEMLRRKMQIYASQLDAILQNEERIKILQHDMKHHMNEIKLMASKHGVVEIQEYINHMEDFIQNPNEIVDSGNMEIDSVLNYMLQKARRELKKVTANVMMPEKIKHSFDINILLGNLLENAIEAARQTEEKYLGVDIAIKKGVLKIQIENTYISENIVKEKRGSGTVFLTTKKAKEKHGIGLKSVRKIVEMYNGTMEVTPQNDIFCVKLILYMSKLENGI
ncbi:MAG: GHKL domain-containing protein [Blautia sp.]|nr:GHKL domain-containing protein [Blautia sp.]